MTGLEVIATGLSGGRLKPRPRPLVEGDIVQYGDNARDLGRVVEIHHGPAGLWRAGNACILWLDGHVDEADVETRELDGHDAKARRVGGFRLQIPRHAAYVRCGVADAVFGGIDLGALPEGAAVYTCRTGTLVEVFDEYEAVRNEIEAPDNNEDVVAVFCAPSACPLCTEAS